jgi:type II secretory pathway pseudopilin PulG
LVCGILVFPAIIAIILGHIALSQINRSGGTLRGRGMAIAGLVLGYLELVLIPIVAILAALAIPTFNVIQQQANLVKAQNEARQIVVAAKTYASEHDGNYPLTLEELVKSGDLADAKLLECSLGGKYPGVKWVYQGAGLKSDAAPETVILTTSSSPNLKSRIVALDRGSVEIVRDASATNTKSDP